MPMDIKNTPLHPSTGEITVQVAGTLSGLFLARVSRTPESIAYRYYDDTTSTWKAHSWRDMGTQIARWRAALAREPLQSGDRVAVMLRNSPEWVLFEQAALGRGLVVVPLHSNDRAENIAHMIEDAGARLLLLGNPEDWRRLHVVHARLAGLVRVLTVIPAEVNMPDARLLDINAWLSCAGHEAPPHTSGPDDLATIVYTSGTAGVPKGVMLSHRNILWNAYALGRRFAMRADDEFLSYLPLSHTFERTVGYYLPMMAGAMVTYARSPQQLLEDLPSVRPTILLLVPRVLEKLYEGLQSKLDQRSLLRGLFELSVRVGWQRFQHLQGRGPWRWPLLVWPLLYRLLAKRILRQTGCDRLRMVSCGAAALDAHLARVFVGLGFPISNGYGLTEASPVVSANALDDNDPLSVGSPLEDVEVRIGDNDELLVKSPGVMSGYWGALPLTATVIDGEGWLHTGDQARIVNRHIYITGRIKDIIVMANGEKVAPEGMERAITLDPLFEHATVMGEGEAYLTASVALNRKHFSTLARTLELDPDDPGTLDAPQIEAAVLDRIAMRLHAFPGYANVRRVTLSTEAWTVENGLLTPTLKVRRNNVLARHRRLARQGGTRTNTASE
ncbi:MAG: AMP-dependent synthetase/ligase [Gammaproteobacteria bacterium]